MANENISPNHIKIGVGTMIRDGNKILLGHRCKNKKDTGGIHEPDTRCFPGGKQEYDETVVQAAIREAKEETNLDIKNPKVFTALDNIATDRHFITIGCICDEFEGELKCMEPESEDERKRFDLDNLPEKIYSPSKDLLEYYKNEQTKKRWKIIGNIIYFLIRGIFATGTIIGIIGGYHNDISLMTLGLHITIICGIVMGILHIICFRIPNKLIKKFKE